MGSKNPSKVKELEAPFSTYAEDNDDIPDFECRNCHAALSLNDLLTFDNNCPNCFESVDPEEYGNFEQEVDELKEEINEHIVDVDDILDAQDATICCGTSKEDCECTGLFKAPTFDEALNRWLNELPDNMYETQFPVPCTQCAFQWTGMCGPLIESLMVCHMRDQENPLGGTDERDGYYIGAIDGCINYTKMTEEDVYVKYVRIKRLPSY